MSVSNTLERGKVLIVDDYRGIAELLAIAFQLNGFDSIIASDSESAMAMIPGLKENGVVAAVVDVNLGSNGTIKTEGAPVIEQIKDVYPDMLVINTGGVTSESQADVYYPKSFSAQIFVQEVMKLLAEQNPAK